MSGIIGVSPDMRSGVVGAFDPEVDTWVFTSSTSTPGDITSNLARYTGNGSAGKLGTGMVESSGIFTFPSIGTWKVTATAGFYSYIWQNYVAINILTTTNGGTPSDLAAIGYVPFAGAGTGNNINGHVHREVIFAVQNTTNYKVMFNWTRQTSSATLRGASANRDTSFQFEKMSPFYN